MKILVTGANGYIGNGVVKALLNLKENVVVTDFNCNRVDERADKKPCNIFEIEEPYAYFGNPDVVLHLAWRNGFVHNSLTHLQDLANHYEFLEKLSIAGIKKIVALGTMHEVGFYEGCIKADTPCNPQSLYGVAKNALRQALKVMAEKNGTAFQWLRGYYIVGNSQFGESIFSKITLAEKDGRLTFPFTTGKNQYDFLDYQEFCSQIAEATVNTETLGIINCCSGEPVSLADRVERFIKENNYRIKLDYGKFPDRLYDSKAVWGDNTLIQKIIEQNRNK
jgi:nucleoside-diphosphate-sugar epimerase